MTGVRRFRELWDSIAPIGRDPVDGGYRRYSYGEAELRLREWFVEQARRRDMAVETDGNGNLWATWTPPGADPELPAVATGSHFDSVPQGGAYDGPLGIVAALLAVDALTERAVPARRPIRLVAFVEEEGARFGVPCLGSRLLTGDIGPQRALALRDADGITLAQAMRDAGAEPSAVGPDPTRLAGLAAFVELHIEQGRGLVELAAPVGLASGIWPHGRWRLDVRGVADHAGTTRMTDRRDPMLTLAFAVLAANKEARLRGAHATVGRVRVEPNATNAVPASATGWLDARASDAATLADLVDAVLRKTTERAARDGTTVELTAESTSAPVDFDGDLTAVLAGALATPPTTPPAGALNPPPPGAINPPLADAPNALPAGTGRRPGPVPILPTAAGHDAGVLAAHLPTAMLFVRNPSGVSHSPAETAEDADCAAGVAALTDVLAELVSR